jgi:hypothetical protein
MARASKQQFPRLTGASKSPRPRPRAALALALLLSAAAVASPATAMRSIETEAHWSGPVLGASSPLRVESEIISLKCRGDSLAATCDFEAKSRLSNPGTEAAAGMAVFYGVRAKPLALRIGGREAAAPTYDVKPFDAAVDAADGEVHLGQHQGFQRHAVALDVPAGATVEIVATGTLRLEPRIILSAGFVFPGIDARHPLLASGDATSYLHGLEYLVSPVASWAPKHRLEVRMRHPRSWQVNGSMSSPASSSYAGQLLTFAPTSVDGEVEEVGVQEGPAPAASRGLLVSFSAELPERLPMNGGPFVGLGSGFGNAGAERFRARFGYEIAAPSWLFESISVDVDFRERVVLTPALEAMTPQLFVLPALSVGIGLPIQLVPIAAPGVRLQGGIQIFFVGLTGAVDIFPGLDPSQGQVQGSLMARLSL